VGAVGWFVLGAVAAMELEAFSVAYRVDGRSRPAHDPAMTTDARPRCRTCATGSSVDPAAEGTERRAPPILAPSR